MVLSNVSFVTISFSLILKHNLYFSGKDSVLFCFFKFLDILECESWNAFVRNSISPVNGIIFTTFLIAVCKSLLYAFVDIFFLNNPILLGCSPHFDVVLMMSSTFVHISTFPLEKVFSSGVTGYGMCTSLHIFTKYDYTNVPGKRLAFILLILQFTIWLPRNYAIPPNVVSHMLPLVL